MVQVYFATPFLRHRSSLAGGCGLGPDARRVLGGGYLSVWSLGGLEVTASHRGFQGMCVWQMDSGVAKGPALLSLHLQRGSSGRSHELFITSP